MRSTVLRYFNFFVMLGLICFVQGQTSSQSTLERIHRNFRVISFHPVLNITSVFFSATGLSVHDCISLCRRLQICAYINFRVKYHLCDLLQPGNSTKYTLEEFPGYVYAIKSEWSMTPTDTLCSQCDVKEYCVPSSNIICEIQACGPPPWKEGLVVYGNRKRVGNKVLYACNQNNTSVLIYTDTHESICLSDGNWSYVNLTCQAEGFCEPETGNFYSTPYLQNTFMTNNEISFSLDDAHVFCISNCGRLVQIYTEDKMTHIRNILQSDIAVTGDFWVDARFDNSRNGWYTSTGEQIPETTSMWGGSPSPSSQFCLRLREGDEYKFNSVDCGYSNFVICEREI